MRARDAFYRYSERFNRGLREPMPIVVLSKLQYSLLSVMSFTYQPIVSIAPAASTKMEILHKDLRDWLNYYGN
jgi:hypothetical protein